jgi:hypothetical protein
MLPNVPLCPFPSSDPLGGDGNLNPPSYPDLFMDDAFWASFVANLNSDTLPAETHSAVLP